MKKNIYVTLFLMLFIGCGKKEKTIEELLFDKDMVGLKKRQIALQKKYDQTGLSLKHISIAIDKLSGKKELPLVNVFVVKTIKFKHEIEVQGSVDTRKNTVLYSEYSGVLRKIYVTEGQKVYKGQLIAKVDDGGLRKQLAKLQIQANLTKTTFERQQRLWKKKIGSEIQYLQAKANKESAEKNVEELTAKLAKTFVRAPFEGVIDNILVKTGNIVIPGSTRIVRIVNLSNMYTRAEVSEVYLGKIKKGTLVEVEIPAIGKKIKSQVRKVGNVINPNNRTFYIEVGLSNKKGLIKPNLMTIMKLADYKNDKAIVIPEQIIKEDSEGQAYVFAVNEKDGKYILDKKHIKKGLTYDDFTEVTEGLKVGNLIVKEGAFNIRSGMTVKINNGDKSQ